MIFNLYTQISKLFDQNQQSCRRDRVRRVFAGLHYSSNMEFGNFNSELKLMYLSTEASCGHMFRDGAVPSNTHKHTHGPRFTTTI